MLSAEEIIAEVTARAKAITTLKGEGEITVESHDGSTSASFDVYLKKPDSVRVEFKGPFGLRVGTLLLTKDKFILYDRTENTAIVGTPDGKTLQSLFRLKMQFEEILSAFTGEFFFKNQTDSLIKFSVHDDQYVLRYQEKDEQREIEVDGTAFFVSSLRLLNQSGNTRFYASAKHPIETNLLMMPSWLRLVYPEEGRSVTISYEDIELNTSVRCSITIPENAEVILR